jgi:hypothetical protein
MNWKSFIVPGVVALAVLSLGGLRWYQSRDVAPMTITEQKVEKPKAPKAPKAPKTSKPSPAPAPKAEPRSTEWCYEQVWGGWMDGWKWRAYEC